MTDPSKKGLVPTLAKMRPITQHAAIICNAKVTSLFTEEIMYFEIFTV
jgi:hypothetical protein